MKDWTEVSNYTLAVLLVGMFLGGGASAYFGSITFWPIDRMVGVVLLTALVGVGVHYAFLRRKLPRHPWEVVAYNLLGYGPLVLALILSINYLGRAEIEEQTFVLQQDTLLQLVGSPLPITIDINDPELSYYAHMRRFSRDEISPEGIVSKAVYRVAEGSLGMRVLISKRLE